MRTLWNRGCLILVMVPTIIILLWEGLTQQNEPARAWITREWRVMINTFVDYWAMVRND